MKLWPLLLVGLCGCQIAKFNKPPQWASAVTHHTRFYGGKFKIPFSEALSLEILLGFGSDTFTVLPVSTNQVFIPKWSDTYSVSQTANPFDMRVREYINAGWEGDLPPPPAILFAPTQSPKDKANK